MRIIVIGAGIGGLALAQALRRAGIDVAVYERDRDRTDRPQGYRLHINPAGGQALRECLPPELFERFVASCGRPPGAMTFYSERLRQLLAVDVEVGGHRSIGREALRESLLTGLDDVLAFGKTCTGYRREGPGGAVTALFEDGTSATGNVLVAADGGNSRIRRQYLPHADRIDTGVSTIAGRLPLTPDVSGLLPDRLLKGPGAVIAPGGAGMFLAVQDTGQSGDDFMSWGLGAGSERLRTTEYGADLPAVALATAKDWHPDLRELIRRTDPNVMTITTIRSAVPVAPWPATTVTLLGDAIHSMTPARGVGANTALRDAALLAGSLAAAHRGEMTLLEAIGGYESQMAGYGFDAVRASLKALKQQTAFESRAALVAVHAALRLLNAVPPLKRRAFAGFGQ